MKNMKFMSKTKLGKSSFWIIIASFVLLFIQYWIAMLLKINIPPFIGLIPMITIFASGIISLTAIIKYKDYTISIFISLLIFLWSIAFIVGELLIRH
jgi:hypothetical protein